MKDPTIFDKLNLMTFFIIALLFIVFAFKIKGIENRVIVIENQIDVPDTYVGEIERG